MAEHAAPFLATADRIGARLCRDALWSGARCTWLGWSMEFRAGQWAPAMRAMGAMLYDGTAGIGLFLARLAGLTSDAIIGATARGALAQAIAAADAVADAGEYGCYAGLGGIAYASLEAAAALDDAALAAEGARLLRRTASIPPHPQRLDVVNGSAGLIPLLLAATGADRDAALAAAVAHGEQLLLRADRAPEGWSWNTMGGSARRNLVGYSHGTAGIACALAELGAGAGRADFRHAANEALRYERRHFVPDQGNWPDFRDFGTAEPTGAPPCMLAWCHGAPGIGIGRLRLRQTLPDAADWRTEAEIAVATTAATLEPPITEAAGSFCLCHGHGGNCDLLLLAADGLERPDLRQRVERVGTEAIARFETQNLPWPCGVPGAGETPNLMLGLAGIGYFYLRLHDARGIPSVLSISARDVAAAGVRRTAA
jgi:class II lanthipeptide synthase